MEIPAMKQPQIYTLDRMTTDFGSVIHNYLMYNVWVIYYKLQAALLNKTHTNINKYSYCISHQVFLNTRM